MSYLKVDEGVLKMLRKYGVKKASMLNDVFELEFFPPVDDLEEKKAEAKDDEVNPATGLTKAQSRDLLGMDE